ncbi:MULTISPECIES: N-acetyltransferase [Yersinia]|uniref:N-acetyltransferase n=1 Tax=Yersinia TaxID=629 RepID=UPI00110F4ED5|nr:MULTISPECIES: N-acetyltransferase [Yersinia]MCB5302809.1 N-acetyltransferase [Yersinia bercovieri]QDW31598.1 N-acetyltransferase [Yersinia sp. KBS0713]
MIRDYQSGDLDALMPLWLSSTIAAHPFVAEQYWHESSPLVRNTYLPAAKTWVYLQQEAALDQGEPIVGFISILEEQLVGALFVEQSFHGKGIGKLLMDYVQQRYNTLTLEVYQQNRRACRFYHNQGFTVIGQAYNIETKNMIMTMHWQRPLY